jgi:oxygen-independent coproporphyrinogen-3 oxidase
VYQRQVQNEASLRAYAQCIQDGRFAITRGVELTTDDRLRRAVIERLMCALQVDLAAIAARFGMAEKFEREFGALASMETAGLVEVTGSHIRITAKGRPLMRTVAAVFDRYLETGGARHSHAV